MKSFNESYKSDRYKYLVGKTIRIEDMDGEPRYTGKEGVVEFVDDAGQLHGTWGGLAVLPGVDSYEVIEDKMTVGYDEDKVGLSVEWVADALNNMLKEEDIKKSSSTPVKSSNLKVYTDKENGDVSVEGQVIFEDSDIEPDTCYCNFNVYTEDWEWEINRVWGDSGTGWGKFLESMLDEGFVPQTAPYKEYIKFDLGYTGKYKDVKIKEAQTDIKKVKLACGPGLVRIVCSDEYEGEYEDEDTYYNQDMADSIEDLAKQESWNEDLAEYCENKGLISLTFDEMKPINSHFYMIWDCAYNEDLISLEEIKDYLSGQLSDGWGEGFEQHPFGADKEREQREFEEEDEDGNIETYWETVEISYDYYYSPWTSSSFEVKVLNS